MGETLPRPRADVLQFDRTISALCPPPPESLDCMEFDADPKNHGRYLNENKTRHRKTRVIMSARTEHLVGISMLVVPDNSYEFAM
jgi:hypothetical protein